MNRLFLRHVKLRNWQGNSKGLVSGVSLFFLLTSGSVSYAQEAIVSKSFSDTDRAYSTQFWSTRQMELTPPLPMPELSEAEYQQRFGTRQSPTREGEQQTIEQQTQALGRVDINKIPYRYGGKLFFTVGSNNYSCSAQYTADPNVLLTAAHCLIADNGTWATNVAFFQRYANGSGRKVTPYCMSVYKGYLDGGTNRWQYDYGFVYMNSPSDAGHFGLKTNWTYKEAVAIGYPGAMDGGQYMQAVKGTIGTIAGNVAELIHGVPPFTYGASGGVWVGDFMEGPGPYNYAISVNSHIYTNRPGRVYGPYFNTATGSLFQHVQQKKCAS